METAYFSDRPWSFGGKQRIKDHNKKSYGKRN